MSPELINCPPSVEPAGSRRVLGSMALSKWIRLLLFIAAASIVYFLGTSMFSAARMQLLVNPQLSSVFHTHSAGQLLQYIYRIRWAAHYLEYFVVFLFLVWAVRLRPSTVLVITVAMAAADEGHQYFLPDRTCSLFDLKLDAAGAATAFLLLATIRLLRGSLRATALSVVPPEGEVSAAAPAGHRSSNLPIDSEQPERP